MFHDDATIDQFYCIVILIEYGMPDETLPWLQATAQ